MIKEIVISDILKEDSIDFKDCLFSDSIISGEKEYKNIKKWIRYAAVQYGDADQILKTETNSQLLVDKLQWENCKYIDCIFSLKTYFNAFLRLYFGKNMPYYGELMDNFDLLFGRDKLLDFQKKIGISEEELNGFLEQLNTFSKQTHTLGNYMPCPDSSYNGKKGYNDGPFHDRIELLYASLVDENNTEYIGNETVKEWKVWFENNQDRLYLTEILDSRKELVKFNCPFEKRGRYTVLVMKSKEDILAYTKYLAIVNELINNRTGKMLDAICNGGIDSLQSV